MLTLLLTLSAQAGDFTIVNSWSDYLELPDPSDSTALGVDPGSCRFVEEIYPCEGEEGHYMAIRLVPQAYPYMVQQVTYALPHYPIDEIDCDATLDHEVFFFKAPIDQPLDPDPVELERQLVPGDAAAGKLREVSVNLLNAIRLDEGESLVVAIQMQGDVSLEVQGDATLGISSCANSGAALCVAACPADDSGETAWWSNATGPSYPWIELQNLGLYNDGVAWMHGFTIGGL
jgi:hypothetical protein